MGYHAVKYKHLLKGRQLVKVYTTTHSYPPYCREFRRVKNIDFLRLLVDLRLMTEGLTYGLDFFSLFLIMVYPKFITMV
jgi:hypothetical protein